MPNQNQPPEQLGFLPKKELKAFKSNTYGGGSLKKRPKTQRPLVPGVLTHVVLKSSKARGDLSLWKHRHLVRRLLGEKARKYFVEIQDCVNMGNHLHLRVKFLSPGEFQKFLRVFCGVLARKMTGARKGNPKGRFWDALAYTRILFTRLEELGLDAYFRANRIEREQGKKAREDFLADWNRFIARLRATRASRRYVPI